MHLNLKDKVALVTGGAGGIGRECCLRLAEAGATVLIHFHRSEKSAEDLKSGMLEKGFPAETFCADVSRIEDVDALFDFVRKTFCRLDILVNSAGMTMDRLLLTMKPVEWDRVLNVNLKGAFLATQKAVELMLPGHQGKIINIASIRAIRGGTGQTNYASAKGGLVSFTRACSVELARKNIQVNAILPGIIVTDMSKRIRKRAEEALLERIPAARFGEASDVARLVVFLASPESDYITGQAIAVDGGLSIA